MPFEIQILIGIQNVVLSTPWMIALAVFFARWFILVNIVLAIVMFGSRRVHERHAVIEAAWSALLALTFTVLIAFFIQRIRPYLATHSVVLLIPPPFNTSFPSGHTATAFAIAFALFYANRTLGILSLVIAGFVAYGRMAVGVHFPTDILGGFFVGLLSFAVVRKIHHELMCADINRSARWHRHT